MCLQCMCCLSALLMSDVLIELPKPWNSRLVSYRRDVVGVVGTVLLFHGAVMSSS